MFLPPHLLDVTMWWGPADEGLRRYLTAKRSWLRERGTRHTLVAPTIRGEGCIALGGLPLPGVGRWPLSRQGLARQLAARRPDLIEVGDPYQPAWAALDAARGLNIPVVGFCHTSPDMALHRFAGAGGAWAAGQYLRQIYGRCDLVLAGSRTLCQRLRNLGIEHAEHQPLGVDTDIFTPASQGRGWREALGLTADSRVVVYAGRFGLDKHLPVLAAAVRRLGEPYVLVALGEGTAPPRGDRVIVLPTPRTPHALSRALASADVFVHAGKDEACGTALLQALACGCPVVAHRSGAAAELIDTQVGELVPRCHPEVYAQAIEAVFEGGLANRAQAARTRAMARRWSAVLPGLMSRYQRLMEAHRHAPAFDWMSNPVSS